MPFDPNQPWTAETSGFDPNKPWTPVSNTPPKKPTGAGTMASPFDLSGGQSRTMIPRGSYYRGPQGELRRNDNGDAGNPIITAPRKKSTMGDVVQSGLTGVVQGLDPYFGAQGDMRRGLDSVDGLGAIAAWRKGIEGIQAPARRAAGALMGSGLPVFSQIGDAALGAMDLAEVGNPMVLGATAAPDSRQVMAARQSVAGPDYVPQTTAGRYARAVGRMTPNALVPGGAVKKTASVVLPAMGGEAARGTAEMMGAGPGGQAVAEIAGQLAAGVGAGVSPGNARQAIGSMRLPVPRKGMNFKDMEAVEQTLRAAKTDAYQAARDYGAVYSPEAASNFASEIAATAARERVNLRTTPKAVGVLEELQTVSGKPMTLDDLDELRQFVGLHLGDGTDAEQRVGTIFRKEIDRFIDTASPEMMMGGDPAVASGLISRARQANQRWRKVEDLVTQTIKKQDRAIVSGVGGNTDNATRQAVLRSYENQRGLSPEEAAAYRRAFTGSPTQNLMRSVGRMSPEMGGLQALGGVLATGVGGATGGAGGLAMTGGPVIAGFVAKRIADGMTRNRVTALVKTLATGGPEAQAAQQELQALARTNADVAAVYDDIIKQFAGGGGLGTALGASAYLAPSRDTAGQ